MRFEEHFAIIFVGKFPNEVSTENSFSQIQKLLQQMADYQARLNLIPYGGKYLYVRKRVGSRLTSTYVDAYSDELYQWLLRNAREDRDNGEITEFMRNKCWRTFLK